LKTVTFVFQRNIFPKSSGYPLRASRWLEAFAGKANVHVVFINARPMNPGAEDYLNGLGVASWKHFEVNRYYIVVAALKALSEDGAVPVSQVAEAIKKYGINTEKVNPLYA
jgi:hypothetical protein